MEIKEFFVVLLSCFGMIIAWQLGTQSISFWVIIPVSFLVGFSVYLLLDKDIFKKKEEKK